MPTVSIIMPVYNKEKYVRKSISSILNQSYTDFELLIINDGSTDNSLSICREFEGKDSRIKLISVPNGGVSKARNIGLDNGRGQYVMFVDSDDYIDCDYLQSFVNNVNDVVIGGLTRVSKEYMVLETRVPKLIGCNGMNLIAKTFYEVQLNTGIYGFVASKLVSLDIINKYKIRFNESIKLAEDYDFFLDVYSKVNSITFINENRYYYIQETENSGIALDDSKVDFYQQIEIQKKAKNFLESKKAFSRENDNRHKQLLTGYVYTILIKNSSLSFNEFKNECIRLKSIVKEVDKNCTGLMKLIINLYDKNKFKIMFYLLKIKKVLVR